MNNKNLKPFKLFALKNFPFIEADFDAITNYELLCKIVEYLNNVIVSQNETMENVQNLSNAFNQLYDYVNNYFENLDVQEEINNKLDEMAEQGTLQEIIADYLNSKAIFGFDNVESMKESTNLINGSYAETLGYYAKKDGGSALYKIRTITNEDVVDNCTIIPLSDETLIAELISDNINIRQFGAYGDGTHDDTDAIQKCINYATSVFIPKGNYIVSDTIVIPKDHKINGEDIDNTVILGTCSGKYIFQYMSSYDYQTFNGLINNIKITAPNGTTDLPKGIDFTNGSIKLTNLKIINITNPIYAGGQYKDNIYIENVTATYSPGYGESDYFFDINCNCDNLYINQLRVGFNSDTWSNDVNHTMRIRSCTGGSISNITLGNHLLLDRCSNVRLNSVHFESTLEQQIQIKNSFISINNLLKWKNNTTADIVISDDSRTRNSNVYLENVEFTYYPFVNTDQTPNVSFLSKDEWSIVTTENVKYRLQTQKTNNVHSNVMFQPYILNPYNNSIDLPFIYEISKVGSSSNLGTYYPTNVTLTWKGGSFTKFLVYMTDNPNSNKYTNKTNNNISISTPCYFHLRNDGIKAKNCYFVIYGTDDDGVTYKRKWVIPVDELGIIFTDGLTFNLSNYSESADYSSEISSYIPCDRIYYSGNYKLYCSDLTNTTYNNGDEIITSSNKYIYINDTIKTYDYAE